MQFICAKNHKIMWMHSFVTSKNVKWCHLIWPTLYNERSMRLARQALIVDLMKSRLSCCGYYDFFQNCRDDVCAKTVNKSETSWILYCGNNESRTSNTGKSPGM